MTKLPILSSRQVIKALRAAGFEDAPKRGKGSHLAMVKSDPEGVRLVIIPDRQSLPKGTPTCDFGTSKAHSGRIPRPSAKEMIYLTRISQLFQ